MNVNQTKGVTLEKKWFKYVYMVIQKNQFRSHAKEQCRQKFIRIKQKGLIDMRFKNKITCVHLVYLF